jgi:hypothetical protein
VNTNGIFNADNVNVGNNDEVNWCEKEIENAKIKTADPLYLGDGLFQGDDPWIKDNHNVINETISSKEGCFGYKQEVTSHQPGEDSSGDAKEVQCLGAITGLDWMERVPWRDDFKGSNRDPATILRSEWVNDESHSGQNGAILSAILIKIAPDFFLF